MKDCPYSINVKWRCLSSRISLASHGLMDEFLIWMGTLYREATSVFVFTTLLNWSQVLKKTIITHLGFFPFKSRPLTKGSRHQGRQIGSQKSVSLCRNGKWTRMCTHAPQSHQHHDVKMASLLCQDSPSYTDVKQRQYDVNRLRNLCSNIEMLFRRCRIWLGL